GAAAGIAACEQTLVVSKERAAKRDTVGATVPGARNGTADPGDAGQIIECCLDQVGGSQKSQRGSRVTIESQGEGPRRATKSEDLGCGNSRCQSGCGGSVFFGALVGAARGATQSGVVS